MSTLYIVSGEDLTSTAKLKIPQMICENCNKISGSVSFLNVSLRRRNVPNIILDESSTFPGCHDAEEPTGFSPPPKSDNQLKLLTLSDELQQVQRGTVGVESDKRSVILTEIVGKIYLLEMELKSLRSNLNKSSQKLLGNRDLKIRYRVVNGNMTKMLFSKYDGIKLS